MAKKPEYNYKSLQTEYGKMPPQAVDLEEAILGSLMLEKDAFITCLLYTSGDDIAIVMYSNLPDYTLLNEGADECIDKGNCYPKELEWRIKAAFRRSQERKE